MSDTAQVIETEAGPLTLVPPRRETFAALKALVRDLVLIESGSASEPLPLLGLLFAVGEEECFGLRTGYGWFEGGADSEAAVQNHRVGRWLIPHALAAFRARGFQGALLPASCLWSPTAGTGPAQVGEMQFVHVRGPMRDGSGVAPVAGFERRFGEGASQALMTFVMDMGAAWAKAGVKRTMTDIEPCRHMDASARWVADLVLVDDRIVLIRPRLDPRDPFLAEMVRAGITEVEYAPSTFVLHAPEAPVSPAWDA